MTASNPAKAVAGPESILLTALVGDALALGPHWVYNQSEITDKIDDLAAYHDPISAYHPGKRAGDQTHYGDQMLTLLSSIAAHRGFDLEAFASSWKASWDDPENRAYRDGATKDTLTHLANGGRPTTPGSDSNDIAAAGRSGPLFLLPWESDEALFAAARAQARFTHGSPDTLQAADFFARLARAVQAGASIPEAIAATRDRMHWTALPATWFEGALASAESDETDCSVARALGLSCSTTDAFPLILHFLLRYPRGPATALVANAEAGGDSAARGLILGLVYGASSPLDTLPSTWLEGLKAKEQVDQLVSKIQANG
jgi:ADP-ribosylglycohydrolase